MARSLSSFVVGMITGGGLLLAGLVLGGQTTPGLVQAPIQDVVRTRRLEIVDEIGTVRAALGLNAAGGTLSVRDLHGRTVLLASAGEHGGVIVVNNTDSKQPAFMAGADEHGGAMQVFSDAGIRVVDATGRSGGQITVANERGIPGLRLQAAKTGVITGFDSSSRPIYQLDAGESNDGRLQTFHPATGVTLVTLDGTPDHHGLMRTSALNGRPLVLLTASSRREGQLYMSNDSGTPLFVFATRQEGPTLRVYNDSGNAAVTIQPDAVGSGTIGVWTNDGDGKVITP